MVSRGEFALIMATIGLESMLLSQDMFAIIVVVVLVTTIINPPMMKWFFKSNRQIESIRNEQTPFFNRALINKYIPIHIHYLIKHNARFSIYIFISFGYITIKR